LDSDIEAQIFYSWAQLYRPCLPAAFTQARIRCWPRCRG